MTYETRTYDNAKLVQDQIDWILTSQSLRFDHLPSHSLQKGQFTEDRDAEQAQLFAILRVVWSELDRFSQVTENEKRRQEFIDEIKQVLQQPDLQPRDVMAYKEIRRIFLEQVHYYAGVGRNESLPSDGLNSEDLMNLGIEKEFSKLTLTSTLLRLGVVYGLIKVFGAMEGYALPKVEDGISRFNPYHESAVIHQIAENPDAQYSKASYEFLVANYGLHSEAGHLVWTLQARAAADRLAKAHADFLKELQARSIEISQVGEALKTISPDLFSSVVNAKDDDGAKQILAAAGISDANAVQNLTDARKNYQAKLALNRDNAQTILLEVYTAYLVTL